MSVILRSDHKMPEERSNPTILSQINLSQGKETEACRGEEYVLLPCYLTYPLTLKELVVGFTTAMLGLMAF